MKFKGLLVVGLIAVVFMAVVFRIPKLRAIVTGAA